MTAVPRKLFSFNVVYEDSLSLALASILFLLLQLDVAEYEGKREGIQRLHIVSNDGQTPAQCRRWWYLGILEVYTRMLSPHKSSIHDHEGIPCGRELLLSNWYIRLPCGGCIERVQGCLSIYP